ncbi:ketoacyl-ACP synthase III family protein [Streptomyces sp. NPDC055078]
METPGLFLTGFGSYFPERRLSVGDAIAQGLCDRETLEFGWHGAYIAGDMPAPEMAVFAANEALARSGHEPRDIDVLLYAFAHHQGPDGWCPPQYVQRHTVGHRALALGVGPSCNAMMLGFEVAANFLLAAPGRAAALVATADNFGTPVFDRWRSNRAMVTSDVASAVVVSRRPGFARLLSVGSVSRPDLEELSRGDEPLFPPSCTTGRMMDFEARFASYEGDLLALATRTVGEVYGEAMDRVLAEAGIAKADITRVVHQIAGAEQHLKLQLAPLGFTLEHGLLEFGQELGRTGASDQLLELIHLLTTGAVGPGDHVLFLGGGPGLVVTCAVVEILERPVWCG